MPGVPNIIEVNLETSEDYLRMLKITRRLPKITKITGRLPKMRKNRTKQQQQLQQTSIAYLRLTKITQRPPKISEVFQKCQIALAKTAHTI